MANNRQTLRNRVNKGLTSIPSYNNEIPLDEIFVILESHKGIPLDEAGEKWTGILCGEAGNCIIPVKFEDMDKPFYLNLTWYKMPSGRYEIVVYLA